MIKNERTIRTIPLFKDSIKKRLLLLKDFELSKMNNFNLTKMFRFQYIIENLLQYKVSEATMKKYISILMQNHHIIILNIVNHTSNIELIVKNLYRENYMYLEILEEILETIKFNRSIFEQVQAKLNQAGLNKLILQVITKFEFNIDNGNITIHNQDSYYNKSENLALFLQITLDFLDNNPDCYDSILYSVNENEPNKNILNLFYMMYFQTNIFRIESITRQILKEILNCHIKTTCSYDNQELFINSFVEFVKTYDIKCNLKFLKFIEVLINKAEPLLICNAINRLQLVPIMISKISFVRNKKTTSYVLKILKFISSHDRECIDEKNVISLQESFSQYKKSDKNTIIVTRFKNWFRSNQIKKITEAQETL